MIYLLMFTLSCIGAYNVNRVSTFLQKVLYSLVVLLSAVLFGLRDKSIGTDTGGYVYGLFSSICNCSSFNTLSSFTDLEFLYMQWNIFASSISCDFNLFLFLTGLLMYGVFYYSFFKERKKISIAFALCIFFFVFYNASYNALRQYMALAFCMVGFSMLMEEKYKMSVCCTLIAYGFHQTAFLFIPVILLKIVAFKYYHILSSRKIRAVFVTILAGCLMSFSYILSFFEKLGMDDKYSLRYGSSDMYGASFPISIFSLCVVNLIVFYSAEKKYYDATSCFFEYVMISSTVLCFAGLISVFATRMNLYYLICSCIIIPFIFRNYILPFKVKIGYILFIFMYWFLTVVVVNLSDTFPYRSKILGM